MTELDPQSRYAADLAAQKLCPDSSQAEIVGALQSLHEALLQRPKGIWPWLINPYPIKGLYIWGGVGRGKTHFLDCFFIGLPFQKKLRIHFHHFMQRIHAELKLLKDEPSPLSKVAKKITNEAQVICFDELQITDITDAVLLAGLFMELFNRGMVFVITSNDPPERLYWGGLQREQFLPAIALIQQHNEVLHIGHGTDYRLQFLWHAKRYYYPLDGVSEKILHQAIKYAPLSNAVQQIQIQGRAIRCRFVSNDAIWFEFSEICGGPRSVADYIEIAGLFKLVLLANIPNMSDENLDELTQFIHLIDELYDRRVKLIATAMMPPSQLYCGQKLKQAFARTASRLEQMASHEYFQQGV